jgi:hypothetical protein
MRRAIVLLALMSVAAGQLPVAAQQTQNVELYHVRLVKAAPGKLADLVDSELKAPPIFNQKADQRPVILRHAQGDDWHLLVITPLGKEATVSPEPPPARQEFVAQARGLSARHSDTFAQGPSWAEAQKLLAGDGKGGGVFLVSTFEPVSGQRDQLLAALKQAPDAAETLVFEHREGAAWQVMTITGYSSWAALGEGMQRERTERKGGVSPVNPHVAAHHDTIAERVTGPIR